MNKTETGGSAFPSHGSMGEVAHEGMTLRQYAAIKLKVPGSGTDWLDAMIVKSLRDDFAVMAVADSYGQLERFDQFKQCAKAGYEMAYAMLEARK